MQTDASQRFERGVDPQLHLRAMERATELLLEIAGGECGPVSLGLAERELPSRPLIWLRRERVARLLGLTIPDERITAILSALRQLHLDVEPPYDGVGRPPNGGH